MKRILLRLSGLTVNAAALAVYAHVLNPRSFAEVVFLLSLAPIAIALDFGIANYWRTNYSEGNLTLDSIGNASSEAFLLCIILGFFFVAGGNIYGFFGFGFFEFAIAVLLFLVKIPLNVPIYGFYSLDKAETVLAYEFLASICGFTSIIPFAIFQFAPIVLLIVYLGASAVIYAVGALHFCMVSKVRFFVVPEFKNLYFLRALKFGALQFLGIPLAMLPTFFVGTYQGIDESAKFRVVYMLCQSIVAIDLAHNMPLWDYAGRNGICSAWKKVLNGLFRRTFILALIFISLGFAIPVIVMYWVGSQYYSGDMTIFVIMWMFVTCFANQFSLIINGSNHPEGILFTQLACIPMLFLVLNALKIIGMENPVVIAYLVTSVFTFATYYGLIKFWNEKSLSHT